MSSTELRKFGALVGGIFLLIGWRPIHHHSGPHPHRIWALALGGLLVALAAAAPGLLRHPYRVWMKIGSFLGTANAYLICAILFYALITPIGWIVRRLGRDGLGLKPEPGRTSYAEASRKRNSDHFRFQF